MAFFLYEIYIYFALKFEKRQTRRRLDGMRQWI